MYWNLLSHRLHALEIWTKLFQFVHCARNTMNHNQNNAKFLSWDTFYGQKLTFLHSFNLFWNFERIFFNLSIVQEMPRVGTRVHNLKRGLNELAVAKISIILMLSCSSIKAHFQRWFGSWNLLLVVKCSKFIIGVTAHIIVIFSSFLVVEFNIAIVANVPGIFNLRKAVSTL